MTLKLLASQWIVGAIPYLFTLVLAGVAALRLHPLIKNKTAQAVFDRLLAAVETAVQAVEQTTVQAMKARQGGVLTPADWLTLKNEAVQMARAALGGGQWIALAQKILDVPDMQKYLEQLVEAAVQRLTTPGPLPATQAVTVAAIPPAKT